MWGMDRAHPPVPAQPTSSPGAAPGSGPAPHAHSHGSSSDEDAVSNEASQQTNFHRGDRALRLDRIPASAVDASGGHVALRGGVPVPPKAGLESPGGHGHGKSSAAPRPGPSDQAGRAVS